MVGAPPGWDRADMKKALLITAAVIVLIPATLALLGVVLGHEKIINHPVAGTVREIVVRSDSGDVRLIRAGSQVNVRETQHYVLRKPTLTRDLTDGVLTLDTDCGAGFFFNCASDLRVTAPDGVKVTVDADSGDVHADGVDVGDVRAQTDSGDVHLELFGRQAHVWAHSDSGDVHVDADGARAIDAETDSGDVHVEARGEPRRVVVGTDSGNVAVEVPAGEYAVDAETDSGDVDVDRAITRNDRAARSLDARTDSGDVTLDGG
jgi:hypothetical protein